MAAISITASEVLPGSDTTLTHGIAGAALTAGQLGYLDTSVGTYKLWDANDSSVNTKQPVFIMTSAASGQPVTVAQAGSTITTGATAALTPGAVYVGGATAGSIHPVADLASGWTTCIAMVCVTASTCYLVLRRTPGVT